MSTSSPIQRNVFQQYQPPQGAFDEFVGESGELRDSVAPFVDAINRLGQNEFARRWQQSERLVHENGFAYSGYVTTDEKPRPWELDALPLLMGHQDWDRISAALQQRAMLLNLILQDLYGPQSLLSEGLIPREILFGHPGFLRPYHGQKIAGQPIGEHNLVHFYAADLARSPDGNWWVLEDRTEAPSGLGFALENRLVISRMLPDLFQDLRVKRLAPFFITMRETLRRLAPQHSDNPHVVLLTPGPNSRNYFEDAFLARYLGYTLVEGGDLAVRNQQLMLKTLGGLTPVDVVLRRQNSGQCDPLELESDSTLGVSGLMQAVRAGKVAVANSLGSGLVESPCFLPWMPQLCQALLGEDLKIPSVATWWCGDPKSREWVLDHLDDLIVQPAFRRRGQSGAARESLLEIPTARLKELIRAEPTRFVAQERVMRSTMPDWSRELQPTHLVLRGYAVAGEQSYEVMQGALARTSKTLDPLEMSIRKGEGSKDTWILSDQPVDPVSLLNQAAPTLKIRRGGAELPSRVADNLFWLGKQLERVESYARLLRATVDRLSGESRTSSTVEIPVLFRGLADQGQIEPGYAVDTMRGQLLPIDKVLPQAVFDKTNPSCLRSLVDEMFRLGSAVRDRVSSDTWKIIQHIDEGFRPAPYGSTGLTDLLALTDQLIINLAAFSGMVRESMTRAQAYRFLELGHRVERAASLIKLFKSCFLSDSEIPGQVLETILEVADSLMTYRSRYMANLQIGAALDLLLTDETNPRSVAYQLIQIQEHVEQLPRQADLPGYTTEERLAMTLVHQIRMIDIDELARQQQSGQLEQLQSLAGDLESRLPALTEAISHRYLVHAGPSFQLAQIRPE